MLLTEEQLDVIREVINIGAGKSAALLNEMVNAPISMQIPRIWVSFLKELKSNISYPEGEKLSSIELNFEGSFSGRAEVVFPARSALNLVSVLTGEDEESDEFDNIKAGTLNEVANVMLNGVLGSISNIFEDHFNYSIPRFNEDTSGILVGHGLKDDMVVLCGETHFEVKEMDIEGDFYLIMELPSFDNLKRGLDKLLER